MTALWRPVAVGHTAGTNRQPVLCPGASTSTSISGPGRKLQARRQVSQAAVAALESSSSSTSSAWDSVGQEAASIKNSRLGPRRAGRSEVPPPNKRHTRPAPPSDSDSGSGCAPSSSGRAAFPPSTSFNSTTGSGGVRTRDLTSAISRAESLQQLQALLAQYGPLLNSIHLSTAFSRLAKFEESSGSQNSTVGAIVFDGLVAATGGRLAGMPARSLATVIWAAARLYPGRQLPASFLASWAKGVKDKLSTFNIQDLSTTMWALGRLRHNPGDKLMTQMVVAAIRELPNLSSAQQLSNLALGLAHLRVRPVPDFYPPFLDAVERWVVADSVAPDTQALANVMWALSCIPGAQAQVPAELVSQALARALLWGSRLTWVQWQDVLCALPRLRCFPEPQQGPQILAASVRILSQCDAQALSNILWALVMVNVVPSESWMAAYHSALQAQIGRAQPEALARILFCYTKVPFGLPEFAPEIWQQVQAQLPKFRLNDLAFAALALSKLEAMSAAESAPAAETASLQLLPGPQVVSALRTTWIERLAEADTGQDAAGQVVSEGILEAVSEYFGLETDVIDL